MKNKKSLYILIPLTILIWGLILWKVFSYSEKSDHSIINYTNNKKEVVSDTISYNLIANYPDPFLRNKQKGKSSTNNPVKRINGVRKTNLLSIAKSLNAPNIVYKGSIERETELTALITYNGSNQLVRVGDTITDFLIEKIYIDSLCVRYQNKVYCYERKSQ